MATENLTKNLGMGAWNRSKLAPPKKTKPKPKPKPKTKALPGTLTGANPTLTKTKPPEGGGFLGNRPALGPGVNAPEVVRGTTQSGQQFTDAQFGQLGDAFKQLADQQYGSIQRIAGGLNNQFTRDARSGLIGATGQADSMTALGQSLADQSAAGFRTAGPTSIEQELYRQGQDELALGGALTAQQARDATQAARQGMAARGMATSMAGLGAELLSRDRYATERQAQRRQFAAGANQMREDNVMGRRDAASRLGALGSTMLADAGRLRQTGAGMMADLDPMQRAMQPGLSLGQTASGMGLDTIGQSYGNMLDLFANTGSFNVNRGDSLYNSWLNNATAIKTGQSAANAQTNAANISAAATRAARPRWWETALGAVGNIFSDERMKTDIKPIGKAGSILGLPAYEFRYKGEKKKRKGFMAQDVQKMLPEAVEEMNYKGKKRLAIKPMVIGQALAQELMHAKAA